MKHKLLMYSGYAREWYWDLFDSLMNENRLIPCQQGLGFESPHSLVIIIPEVDNILEAFSSVDLPRMVNYDKRLTFSLLYSLRRILGYHETVLFDKYPILRKYVSQRNKLFYSRSTSYLREEIPEYLKTKPWVKRIDINGCTYFGIDQIARAAWTLGEPDRQGSRTCLVDFGDGYKSRCVMSWLFIVRDGFVNAYNHMRSNDLLIGMPNDLIDLRLCQLVIVACTGLSIGYLHHQASLFQVYKKDIANTNQLERLLEIRQKYVEEDNSKVINKISRNRLFCDIVDVLQEYMNRPTSNGEESLNRYHVIMQKFQQIFWYHNPECSTENKQHVLGSFNENKESL